MEVDEDRAETRALELDTEAGLWTARERFYIGDTEHMACVTSDRRGDKQGQRGLLNISKISIFQQTVYVAINENLTLTITTPNDTNDEDTMEDGEFLMTEEIMWIVISVNIAVLTCCVLCLVTCLVSRCRGRRRSLRRRYLFMDQTNNNNVLHKERSLKRKAPEPIMLPLPQNKK